MTHGSTVSVVTAAYNSARFIAQAIESVLGQTHSCWEMLIVDDCSTDDTAAIAGEYARRDGRVRVISLAQNRGPAHARNEAIRLANGRFIAFLDSDDMWAVDKLAKQTQFMLERDVCLSFTSYQKIDSSGRLIGKAVEVPDEVDYGRLLHNPVIACLTAMYDSERLGKVFMPDILRRQDYGLWLKILRGGVIARSLGDCLAYYRVGQSSLSSNKLLAAAYVWKLFREVENLSWLRSVYHFAGYSVHGVRKSLNR